MGKHELVAQNGLAPTAKVLAGWVTGAGAVTVLGVLAAISPAIPVDTFWGGLAAYAITGAASWIKKAHVADQGA